MNDRTLDIIVRMKDQASKTIATVTKNLTDTGKAADASAKRISLFQRSVSALSAGVRGTLAGLASMRVLFVQLAALLAAGRLVTGFSSLALSIDALNDSASQLNISTASLSSLQFGATFSGSNAEQMTSALQRFSVQIGTAAEAARGSETAFTKLGVAIRDANGNIRATDDVLFDVADALQKVPSSAERAKIATELFGREAGPKLLNYLGQGREAMRAFRREAESFGVVIDAKLASDAAAFGDAMDRLRFAIRGVFLTIQREALPVITQYVNGFAELIRQNREAIAFFLSDFTKSLASVATVIGNLLLGIPEIFNATVNLVANILAGIPEAMSKVFDAVMYGAMAIKDILISTFQEALKGIAFEVERFAKLISGSDSAAGRGLAKVTKSLAGFGEDDAKAAIEQMQSFRLEIESSDKAADSAAANFDRMVKSIKGAGSAFTDQAGGTGKPAMLAFVDSLKEVASSGRVTQFAEYIRELGTAFREMAPAVEETNRALEKQNRLLAKMKELGGAAVAGIKRGFQDYADTLTTAEGISNRFASMTNGIFTSIESSATSAFESVLKGSMSAGDAFKQFGASIVSTLLGVAAQMAVLIPLAILFNVLTGGLLSVSGVASTAASLASVGGMIAGVGGIIGGSRGGAAPSTSGPGGTVPNSYRGGGPMDMAPSRVSPSTSSATVININAMDSKSVRDLFMREGRALTDAWAQHAPRNPAAKDAGRKVIG